MSDRRIVRRLNVIIVLLCLVLAVLLLPTLAVVLPSWVFFMGLLLALLAGLVLLWDWLEAPS